MSKSIDVVIITGAAQGIGRCLALGFAQQGYRVCAIDVQPMSFDGVAGIATYIFDLAQTQQIEGLFAQIVADWGHPHILINNAAISQFHRPMGELEPLEFERLLRVNLTAAFACAKYFVQAHRGDYGRIINMASTRYHQNEADWEAYGASKGGIVSLTNSLCVSLSGKGITVNAISPGWIHTGDADTLSTADHAQHPSGRVGRPDDILRACLYLCERGNDFINGANILIDGGMTKRMIYVD